MASQLLFTKCFLRGAKSVAYEDRVRNRQRDRNGDRKEIEIEIAIGGKNIQQEGLKFR